MFENLFFICSIVVFHPDHTEYIPLKRCRMYRIEETGKLLQKYGINPFDHPDVVLSPNPADLERRLREGMEEKDDDEEIPSKY